MKLKNSGAKFEMTYDSKDVKIPSGSFEVSSSDLGHFIVTVSSRWGKDVRIIDDQKSAEIKEDIVQTEKEEEDSNKDSDEADEVIKEAQETIKKGKAASKKGKEASK